MSNPQQPDLPAKGQFLVYQTEDGQMKVDVRLEGETAWLTQALMAELFQKDVRTINEHLVNIFQEGELNREATIRKFRIVRQKGSREVSREVEHYNLEAIISVGYRVKSQRCSTSYARSSNHRLSTNDHQPTVAQASRLSLQASGLKYRPSPPWSAASYRLLNLSAFRTPRFFAPCSCPQLSTHDYQLVDWSAVPHSAFARSPASFRTPRSPFAGTLSAAQIQRIIHQLDQKCRDVEL